MGSGSQEPRHVKTKATNSLQTSPSSLEVLSLQDPTVQGFAPQDPDFDNPSGIKCLVKLVPHVDELQVATCVPNVHPEVFASDGTIKHPRQKSTGSCSQLAITKTSAAPHVARFLVVTVDCCAYGA